MHRIDQVRASEELPEPAPQGTPGFFQNTDPAGDTPVSQSWMNAVQEEIAGAVSGLGGSLTKGTANQLATYINQVIGKGARLEYIPFAAYDGNADGLLIDSDIDRTKTWELALIEGAGLDPATIRMIQIEADVQVDDPYLYEFNLWYTTYGLINGRKIISSKGVQGDTPPSTDLYHCMIPVQPNQESVRLRIGTPSVSDGPIAKSTAKLIGAWTQAPLGV